MDEMQGRCVGCGFLSWRRHNDDAAEYHEVSEDRRKSGVKPDAGALHDVSHAPYCFRRVPIHGDEFDQAKKTEGTKPKAFLKVIREPRNCPHFYRYAAGRSPEKHEDMEATEHAESSQAESISELHDREDRRQKADMIHRWKMQQRAAADARAAETARWDRETARGDREWKRSVIRGLATALFTIALSGFTFLLGRGCDNVPATSGSAATAATSSR
jgi:hypothetical protein